MFDPAQDAVDLYVRAGRELDPERRAALIAECWAEDGRLVAHGGGTVMGRQAIGAMFERFIENPRVRGFRVLAKDVRGKTFRLRYVTDFADGTARESLDVGELNETGRIALLLVFPADW